MLVDYPFQLERPLQFQIGGKVTTGHLFVGNIRWLEDKKQWACHWSISHIHPEVGRLYGSDPLGALTTALDFISSLIRGSEKDGLIVWWKKRGDHAGITFPLCEHKSWDKMPPQN